VVFERIGNTKQTTVLVNSFWGIIIKADENLVLRFINSITNSFTQDLVLSEQF